MELPPEAGCVPHCWRPAQEGDRSVQTSRTRKRRGFSLQGKVWGEIKAAPGVHEAASLNSIGDARLPGTWWQSRGHDQASEGTASKRHLDDSAGQSAPKLSACTEWIKYANLCCFLKTGEGAPI